MTYLFCHECKEERTAEFNYDPIDGTMVVTCNTCNAAWTFETSGSYQTSGPTQEEPTPEKIEVMVEEKPWSMFSRKG